MDKPTSKPLSRSRNNKVFRYPDDGVKRFEVKGARIQGSCTYHEAFDTIIEQTKSSKQEKGGYLFTGDGIRRISALNQLYVPVAMKFLRQCFIDEQKKRQAEAERKRHDAELVKQIPVIVADEPPVATD